MSLSDRMNVMHLYIIYVHDHYAHLKFHGWFHYTLHWTLLSMNYMFL